jgi:hypothetical protein
VLADTGESSAAPAVQVTRQGGYNVFKPLDGKYLYFQKLRQGLRCGGDLFMAEMTPRKSRFLNRSSSGSWWSLSPDGVYFFQEQPAQPRPTTIALKFFNLQSRRISELAYCIKRVGPLAL